MMNHEGFLLRYGYCKKKATANSKLMSTRKLDPRQNACRVESDVKPGQKSIAFGISIQKPRDKLQAIQAKYFKKVLPMTAMLAFKLKFRINQNILQLLAHQRTQRHLKALDYNHQRIGSEVHWNPESKKRYKGINKTVRQVRQTR